MTDKEIKEIINRLDFDEPENDELRRFVAFAIMRMKCPSDVEMIDCKDSSCSDDFCSRCWFNAFLRYQHEKEEAADADDTDDLKSGNESEPIPTTSIAHRRPLIYCAHPYRGDTDEAIDATEKIRELAKKYPQYTFVSPIHAIRRDYQGTNYEEGMECCMSLLAVCDAIYMMDGKQPWTTSIGCNMEYDFAIDNHMPILKSYADLEAWAVKKCMRGLVGKMDVGIDHSIAEDLTVNINVHQCDGCNYRKAIDRIKKKIMDTESSCVMKKEILRPENILPIFIETLESIKLTLRKDDRINDSENK